MAHFAELDKDNIVLRVIVVHNSELLDEDRVEQESLGIKFCQSLFGGNWIQTSYNGKFRGRFAGKGSRYNKSTDTFENEEPS